MMLQHSQAVGLPYSFMFASQRLQIVDVDPLLQIDQVHGAIVFVLET